ncbi:MAG: P-II family nitrogen regulator [Methanosarcinales archaeon]|nr:P-II family nitrogen regulator [Methanosarcinales archaeon]
MQINTHNVIYVIVERQEAEKIVKSAKNAGAEGATIFFARGTGVHENKTLFGIPIESEREIILIITKKEKTKKILEVVIDAGELNKEGKGIAFVQDVSIVAGIVHQEQKS